MRGVYRASDTRFIVFSQRNDITMFNVTLWTKGVALRYFSAHQVKGYSLLTKGVVNPLASGIFTLD